jgi:hypothetical protein
MENPHPESAEKRDEVAYDRSTISLKGVVWFVVIFIVFGIAAHVLIWCIWSYLDRHREERNVAQNALMSQTVQTPTPRLQPSPGDDAMPWKDLQDLRARELAEFKRRGWVNEKTGQLEIPDAIVQQVAQMSAQKGRAQ